MKRDDSIFSIIEKEHQRQLKGSLRMRFQLTAKNWSSPKITIK